jgi:hypothetical protein
MSGTFGMTFGSSRQIQFSLRSLLMVIAVAAFVLAPVVWIARQRQEFRRLQAVVLEAREAALRSVVMAERAARQSAELRASGLVNAVATEARSKNTQEAKHLPTVDAEQLRRENSELKETIERLRREVDRLKASNQR